MAEIVAEIFDVIQVIKAIRVIICDRPEIQLESFEAKASVRDILNKTLTE